MRPILLIFYLLFFLDGSTIFLKTFSLFIDKSYPYYITILVLFIIGICFFFHVVYVLEQLFRILYITDFCIMLK